MATVTRGGLLSVKNEARKVSYARDCRRNDIRGICDLRCGVDVDVVDWRPPTTHNYVIERLRLKG